MLNLIHHVSDKQAKDEQELFLTVDLKLLEVLLF
jgi:hypothetical protein